jgi:hypothetical protein
LNFCPETFVCGDQFISATARAAASGASSSEESGSFDGEMLATNYANAVNSTGKCVIMRMHNQKPTFCVATPRAMSVAPGHHIVKN